MERVSWLVSDVAWTSGNAYLLRKELEVTSGGSFSSPFACGLLSAVSVVWPSSVGPVDKNIA